MKGLEGATNHFFKFRDTSHVDILALTRYRMRYVCHGRAKETQYTYISCQKRDPAVVQSQLWRGNHVSAGLTL